MSQEIIIGSIAAAAIVLAAVLGVPRVLRDARWSITRDIEIYKALPETSAARENLLKKIDREVDSLDVHDQKRRHPLGIGLGVSFLVFGIAALWFVIIQGGVWWISSPLVFFGLVLGLVGLFMSAGKTLRDEKGSTIKPVE